MKLHLSVPFVLGRLFCLFDSSFGLSYFILFSFWFDFVFAFIMSLLIKARM